MPPEPFHDITGVKMLKKMEKEKLQSETSLNVRVAAEGVKEVRDKISSIEMMLKENRTMNELNTIGNLKGELEAAKNMERTHCNVIADKEKLLQEKASALDQLQTKLLHAEDMLKEQEASNQRARDSMVEVQELLQEKENQLHEMEAARLQAENERAELHQSNIAKKDQYIADLERRSKSLADQCGAHSGKLEELANENAELRERIENDTSILMDENDSLKSALDDLTKQYSNLDIAFRSLQEDQTRQESRFKAREEQLKRRVAELTELSAELEARELKKQGEMHGVVALAAADLERQKLDFQHQRQEMERQLELQRQDLESQVNEQRDRYRKVTNTDKENQQLRQASQKQKNDLWQLQCQLRRETLKNNTSPAEHFKLAKKLEAEGSLATRCSEMEMRHSALKCELEQMQRFNNEMRRHLSPEVVAAVVREMQKDMEMVSA